ncbi:MAG: AAA family ATPase [Bacillota bacterium]
MMDELIPKLIRACFDNDKNTVEAVSLMMIKKLRKSNPDVAKEISEIISYINVGAPAYRSADILTVPVDRETRYSLAKVEEPIEIPQPILSDNVWQDLVNFLSERNMVNKFLEEGITPPTSIIFSGSPGVGKTYIAKWLSYKLNLPLISMDLATSISSYLGRSGQNMKSLFDYAKSFPSILLLDEFDAVAKRRDDISDLGELKRLVNIILKELEVWPSSSIVIAATNHPELLDRAIWRRFDRVLEIPLPGKDERLNLLNRHLKRYFENFDKDIINFITLYTEGMNAADICKLCEHIKRRTITSESNIGLLAIQETCKANNLESKSEKVKLCVLLKDKIPNITYREISNITGIPLSTVNRYLKEGIENEE